MYICQVINSIHLVIYRQMNYSRSLLFVLSFAIISVSFNRCTPNQLAVNGLIKLGTSLVNLFNTYANQSKVFKKQITEVRSVSLKGIEEKKNFTDIATFIEDQRTNLYNQYNGIVGTLNEINATSAQYFAELDNNTLQIPDKKIRAAEVEKNKEKKKQWMGEFNSAQVALNGLAGTLQQYETVYRVMRNEILRGKLDESITMLQTVTNDISTFETKVQVFTSNAQVIFALNSN
jgi:hypothetical protein